MAESPIAPFAEVATATIQSNWFQGLMMWMAQRTRHPTSAGEFSGAANMTEASAVEMVGQALLLLLHATGALVALILSMLGVALSIAPPTLGLFALMGCTWAWKWKISVHVVTGNRDRSTTVVRNAPTSNPVVDGATYTPAVLWVAQALANQELAQTRKESIAKLEEKVDKLESEVDVLRRTVTRREQLLRHHGVTNFTFPIQQQSHNNAG